MRQDATMGRAYPLRIVKRTLISPVRMGARQGMGFRNSVGPGTGAPETNGSGEREKQTIINFTK